MTTYDYRDDKHFMICTFPIGTAPREIDCPKCKQPMKLVIGAGVNIAPSSLEHKGASVREVNDREKEIDRDRPAYRRMRKRGLQPPHISGSADLENQAGDQMDIDYRDLFEKGAQKEQVREGIERAQMIDLGVA